MAKRRPTSRRTVTPAPRRPVTPPQGGRIAQLQAELAALQAAELGQAAAADPLDLDDDEYGDDDLYDLAGDGQSDEPDAFDRDDVTVDFDRDYLPPEAPTIRLMGNVYTLPPEPPAELFLFGAYAEQREAQGRPLDIRRVMRMLSSVLGAENLEELIGQGIGIPRLGQVMVRIRELYETTPGGRGNAPAPNRATRRQSTGRRRR